MTHPTFSVNIDDFALRHFQPERGQELGLTIPDTPQAFVEYVKEITKLDRTKLLPGYAPFCKHLIVPNKYPVLPSSVPLSADVEPLVKSGYVARRETELPVLSRWVPWQDAVNNNVAAKADYIDVILYSRDQVIEENKAMNSPIDNIPDVEWLIISLKFQNQDYETPMQPITAMRNALISEGGSGVPIDRAAYSRSVDFWSANVELQ